MATRSRAASGIPPAPVTQVGRGTRSSRGPWKRPLHDRLGHTSVVCPGSSSDGRGAGLQEAMVETSRSRPGGTLQLGVVDHAACASLPIEKHMACVVSETATIVWPSLRAKVFCCGGTDVPLGAVRW